MAHSLLMSSHEMSVIQHPRATTELGLNLRDGFFHAMLSYRVATDGDIVTKIHDKIHLLGPGQDKIHLLRPGGAVGTQLLDSAPFPSGFTQDQSVINSSIRVFLDHKCLKNGREWGGSGDPKEGGFIAALRLSHIFVPLFSAEVDKDGKIAKGSLGQLINLGTTDALDNVLLELIIARELHLLSKNIPEKAMFPCFYILPLFRSQEVWKAASDLPKKPSTITNTKALKVLKKMLGIIGIPESDLSKELKYNTLEVKSVWDFYANFQGLKMYGFGEESNQILAVAKHIIDMIKNSAAEFTMRDSHTNFSQMFELFEFMSNLNMANYAPVLAMHNISNVFQLSQLKASGFDEVVRSIAEQCAQASKKSTIPSELVNLRSAILAARASPLGKPLNERFRNFIDHDASFVTTLSSSSLWDIFLSKTLALQIIVVGCLILLTISSITAYQTRETDYSDSAIFPNDPAMNTFSVAFQFIPLIFVLLSCGVAYVHSPRAGRYVMAVAILTWAISDTLQFSVIVKSAIEHNCFECAYVPHGNYTIIQQIMIQPVGLNSLIWWPILICILTKQQHTAPTLFSAIFVLNIVKLIAFGFRKEGFDPASAITVELIVWGLVYIFLKVFQNMGNQRGRSIYALNEEILNNSMKTKTDQPQQSSDTSINKLRDLPSINSHGQLLQRHATFESLIRDAEFVNFSFQEWVSSWLSAGPSIDITQFCRTEQGIDDIDLSFRRLNTQGTFDAFKKKKLPNAAALESSNAFKEFLLPVLNELWSKMTREEQAQYTTPSEKVNFPVSLNAVFVSKISKLWSKMSDEEKERYENPSEKPTDAAAVESYDAFTKILLPVLHELWSKMTREEQAQYTTPSEEDHFPVALKAVLLSKITELWSKMTPIEQKRYQDIYMNGVYIRGPVKHVDRAIAKAYRTYSRNFKRLTDVVRCCVVMETADDVINLVQKIKQNAYIVEPKAAEHAIFQFVSSAWDAFCVRVLGLIPVKVEEPPANSDTAFELLRIRNRFSSLNPIGGYRDINLKIRIGFKSDTNTGLPVFCPVHVWNEQGIKTLIVEVQVHLKEYHTCMEGKDFHNNYMRSRNLMSQ